MKIIVKDILPEFVFIFGKITRVNFLEMNGLRQTNEGYTLETRENHELWYTWIRFLETDKSIDDYFGVNAILAVKSKNQQNFTIKRSDILKSGRKKVFHSNFCILQLTKPVPTNTITWLNIGTRSTLIIVIQSGTI